MRALAPRQRALLAGLLAPCATRAQAQVVPNTVSGWMDGVGTNTLFQYPQGVAFSADTNTLYITDYSCCLRMMDIATGNVSTPAGTCNDVSGYANGIGAAVLFMYPQGVTVDSLSGTVFIADTGNNVVRSYTPGSGAVDTLAGGGNNFANPTIGYVNGLGTSAQFSGPYSLVADGAGNIFVADGANQVIRKIVIASSTVSTLLGTQGCTPKTPTTCFYALTAVTYFAGTLYFTDKYAVRSARPDSPGVVTFIAGTTAGPGGYANGVGAAALFKQIVGVAISNGGATLLVADGSNALRAIDVATTNVTTIAGPQPPSTTAGFADGTGTSVMFNDPYALANAREGIVYITDANNNLIRRFNLSNGEVTWIAGGYSPPSPTASVSVSASVEPSPSYSPSPPATASLTATSTSSVSLSATATTSTSITMAVTSSVTPSSSISLSASASQSASAAATASPSGSSSPPATFSVSASSSVTSSVSTSSLATSSESASTTASPSVVATTSASAWPSVSASSSASASASPPATATRSASSSTSPSGTVTPSAAPTATPTSVWPSVPIVVVVVYPIGTLPDSYSVANLTATLIALRCDYAAASGLLLRNVGLPADSSAAVASGANLAANVAAAVATANAAMTCPLDPPSLQQRRRAVAAAADAADAPPHPHGQRLLANASATLPLMSLTVLLSLVPTDPGVIALGGGSRALTAVLAEIAASPPATFVLLDATWGAANNVVSFLASFGVAAVTVISVTPGGASILATALASGLSDQQKLGLGLGIGLTLFFIVLLAAACACWPAAAAARKKSNKKVDSAGGAAAPDLDS